MAEKLQPTESLRPSELDRVMVQYEGQNRRVVCFCGETLNRTIVQHLKTAHADEWRRWVHVFLELRGLGYPLKRIMRLFKSGNGKLLFSWTVIERAIRREVESGEAVYTPPPKKKVPAWKPKGFSLETTTVWDFPRRGDWAVHSGDYRGNWPPQIPRNLIERYTSEGDLIVDAFVGGGTSLIEAWLLGRRSVGIDVGKLAIQTTSSKLLEMEALAKASDEVVLNPDIRPIVLKGDSLKLTRLLRRHGIKAGEVALLCAHPPYLNSLEYTVDDEDDLALVNDCETFYARMRRFAQGGLRVLRPSGICGLLIGDVRKDGEIIPLGFKTLGAFISAGFDLENIAIKTQHKDRSTEFYRDRNDGALLMAHEYLFIFRKPTGT